jgi:hypothetical protein
MIRSSDDIIARQQHEHIAKQLGISHDVLDLHMYRIIDAGLGFDPPRWRILWDGDAPEGVRTMGEGDHRWSEIVEMAGEGAGRSHIDG